jgi:hypothetical protein
MKTKSLVVISAVIVTVAISALWLYPRERHVEVVFTGREGARVSGVYFADGNRHDFRITLPASISANFLRTFSFTAEKEAHAPDFTAAFKSDSMKAPASTRASRPRISASYYAPVRGFSKGNMSAEPR